MESSLFESNCEAQAKKMGHRLQIILPCQAVESEGTRPYNGRKILKECK